MFFITLRRSLAFILLFAVGGLLAQSMPQTAAKNPAPLFLVESNQAGYSNQNKPDLGFVVQGPAGIFVVKTKYSRSETTPTLRINPLGLPAGQGFATRTLLGSYKSGMGDVVLYTIDLPMGFQPLTIAAQPPRPGETVKVWLWDSQRRQPVEVAATVGKDPARPDWLQLSRKVEQRQVLGAPVCNAGGEVIGIGFSQSYGAGAADQLVFLPLQRAWITPGDDPTQSSTATTAASGTTASSFPSVWRLWELDGKTRLPAIALAFNSGKAEITLGVWHELKWVQRPLPLSRLSEQDRNWIKAMTAASFQDRSVVPISRARAQLVINAPDSGKTPWPVSKALRRPCMEIDGVAGTVLFRGRSPSQDRSFSMTDPAFITAVQKRTLDQLIGQRYVTYTPLGTLTIPVKLMNFPLLGQDNTGTCYVSHYREWLTYYLGDRAALLPCLEDLRSYLNFLLYENPSLPELFASRDSKSANAFDAQTRLARVHSRDFLNNVGFFCRTVLIGEETLPYTRFTHIDGSYQDWKFSGETRQFSEAQFGSIMEGLLLGQMTLGSSETHVMNIIGIDDDRLMISTWSREYQGTLRELSRLDQRGPVLAPITFDQFPIIARNAEGRAVIPRLDPLLSRALTSVQTKAMVRFNQGSGN